RESDRYIDTNTGIDLHSHGDAQQHDAGGDAKRYPETVTDRDANGSDRHSHVAPDANRNTDRRGNRHTNDEYRCFNADYELDGPANCPSCIADAESNRYARGAWVTDSDRDIHADTDRYGA